MAVRGFGVGGRAVCQILDPASVSDDVKPLKIDKRGNYGVAIEWDDGHQVRTIKTTTHPLVAAFRTEIVVQAGDIRAFLVDASVGHTLFSLFCCLCACFRLQSTPTSK